MRVRVSKYYETDYEAYIAEKDSTNLQEVLQSLVLIYRKKLLDYLESNRT